MRILHVVASLEARHGGPSRSVRQLALAQAELGHVVELATTGPVPAEESPHPNLTIRTFGRRWPSAITRSPSLAAHLKQCSVEVIHAHGLWLRPLHYAHLTAGRQRIPLVIAPRGMMTPWAWNHHRRRKQFASNWVHPGALSAARGWHATSAVEAEEIRALGFTQPACVAPNAVEIPSVEEQHSAREHWQRRAPELAGRRVALFYSRFHSKKRVIELIDLWLAQSDPAWLLLMVGIPDQFSVPELSAYVQRQSASHRVLVLDGTSQPPPFAVAELFILPSHSENFGLVVAESLAHRVPVLVTDTTPWQELERHRAGWWVNWAHFPPTLRAALALTSAELRAGGEAGQAWVREAFVWSATAQHLLGFYRQLH